MAVRSLLTNLKRAGLELEAKNHLCRQFCSYHHRTPPISSVRLNAKKELVREILRLKHPDGCVITVIENWSENGIRASFDELRSLATKLMKSKRYNHSLQIMDWLECQSKFRMSPADHAIKTESIIEAKGLDRAREYFETLTGSARMKAASFPLLRDYVKRRETQKAEAFMARLNGSGLIVTDRPYNEMMKLYAATSQFGKVSLVIAEMKRNGIPLTVLSYNLWMNACFEVSGIGSVEAIFKEMAIDEGVEIGWSSLATLANAYARSGQFERANSALISAEKKLSSCDRFGYLFLMTQHASLKNKHEVLRLWELSKAAGDGKGRFTCANYMSVILCLVKSGDLAAAERLFEEWEANRGRYDIRVSNVLLGAYARSGSMMEKAEALHLRTVERGGCPNYKTWEILAEGWVRSRDMEKAIDAMEKACSLLKHCHWRPSQDVVMAIAEHYEKQGDFKSAGRHVKTAHNFGFASLPLYKSLLRVRRSARRPAHKILEMMEKDKIEVDEEARALIQAANGN